MKIKPKNKIVYIVYTKTRLMSNSSVLSDLKNLSLVRGQHTSLISYVLPHDANI